MAHLTRARVRHQVDTAEAVRVAQAPVAEWQPWHDEAMGQVVPQ